MADEALTKIYVDLPGHWHYGGESLWARALGNDLYEIRNVPSAAYGLNFGDVVLAVSADPNLKPEIRSVVAPSGRATMRLFFRSVERDQQASYLEQLRHLGADIERADDTFLALDNPAEADYSAIFDHLSSLEGQGLLEFETGEARVPGSFTSAPEPTGPDAT